MNIGTYKKATPKSHHHYRKSRKIDKEMKFVLVSSVFAAVALGASSGGEGGIKTDDPKKEAPPLKVRTWEELRTGLANLCPKKDKKPMRYCPLIKETKDFLGACPEIIETLNAALGEVEQAVMQKYLQPYVGALRSLGRKEIKEKDEKKRKKLEEKQKEEEEEMTEEEKQEMEWGNGIKLFAAEINKHFKEKKAVEAARCLIDSILHLLEHMKEGKKDKCRLDFLSYVEKVLERMVMLGKSKRMEVEEEEQKMVVKMANAVEKCRPLHQRTVFIVILTLVLLGVMSLIVGVYLVKTTQK